VERKKGNLEVESSGWLRNIEVKSAWKAHTHARKVKAILGGIVLFILSGGIKKNGSAGYT